MLVYCFTAQKRFAINLAVLCSACGSLVAAEVIKSSPTVMTKRAYERKVNYPKTKPVILLPTTESRERDKQLPEIVVSTLKRHFRQDSTSKSSANDMTGAASIAELSGLLDQTANYRRRAGLFVTLSRNGQTRACWGSIESHYPDLITATAYTTEAALNNDYRFPPIRASEIDSLTPQVTVVNKVELLRSLGEQNPRRCGMLVRSGGKVGVILPGETSDPYFQLIQCKLKAGIKKNEPCQVYRIEADVYR
jgi:AMMECR1 domain-containing protein